MTVCLGIDASAQEISAAVVVDGVLASEKSAGPGPSGEILISLVRNVLEGAGKTLADVERIAVGIGPGSFTGIRNGIATAQGLATKLSHEPDRQVLGVSALIALAETPAPGELHLLSFPANAQEDFCALLARAPDGAIELKSGALVLTSSNLHGEAERLCAELGDSREGSAPFVRRIESSPGPTLAARAALLTFRRPACAEAGLGDPDERRSLYQETAGGRGLRPVYAKPVHARTLVERGFPLTRIK